MKHRSVLVLIAIAAFALGPGVRPADASSRHPLVMAAQTGSGSSTTGAAQSTATSDELQQLQRDVSNLDERLGDLFTFSAILVGVLTLILMVGTGASIVSLYRTESRAGELHMLAAAGERASQARSEQLHQLAMAGESASQGRAAEVHQTFLSSSKDTLDLVNGTLGLAKEASERAAQAIQRKAQATLDDLDRKAKELIAKVPQKDDRGLVANQVRRSELTSLAHKISGFEINRFILPTDLPLTPPCLFIRGMQFHLDQQFADALDCWNEVALSDNTPDPIRSLAWYWIGYEQNNLAQFGDAEMSFARARETADGARGYELQRIVLESRFFNSRRYPAEDLIQPLEALKRAIESAERDDDIEFRRIKIITTLGNVHYQAGREARKRNQEATAREHYHAAQVLFTEAVESDRSDQWAVFGLAESNYQLGKLDEAYAAFAGPVRTHAINEYLNRVEPRTKVLARTTELMCYLRVPTLWSQAPTIHDSVIEALGQVDERLTVYSQIQRRNVTKTDFRGDLAELMQEFEGMRQRTAGSPGQDIELGLASLHQESSPAEQDPPVEDNQRRGGDGSAPDS
jgi:tetratricopeptide (TPR) repeat protein